MARKTTKQTKTQSARGLLSRMVRALGRGVRWIALLPFVMLTAIGRGIDTAIRFVGRVIRAIVRFIVRGIVWQARLLWAGIVNTVKVLYLIVYTVVADVLHIVRAVVTTVLRLPIAAAKAVGRALKAIWIGFVDLLRQLGNDLKALAKAAVRVPVKLAKERVIHPVVKASTAVTAPLRRQLAKRAKTEALGGGATVTPDHASHKELFILIGGVLLLAGGAVAWLTLGRASVPGAGIATKLSRLTPERIINKLANFTPDQMLLTVALTALGVGAVWFWLRMVQNAWTREYPSRTEQTRWRLITLLLFVPGAAYYFKEVYNHWTLKQFLSYHLLSVMVTSVALVVTTSSYGTLWYFNQRAEAQVKQTSFYAPPNLNLDPSAKQAVLGRTRYGQPLDPNAISGRTDPFAPVPGVQPKAATPSPRATPSGTVTPPPS